MATYYYDRNGWLTSDIIEGRNTEIDPPVCNIVKKIGRLWPNWTGTKWIAIPYFNISASPLHISTNVLKIQTGEFLLKFTQDERVNMRNSADSKVIDFLDILSKSLYVDLMDTSIIASLNYLKDIQILTDARVVEILTLNPGVSPNG